MKKQNPSNSVSRLVLLTGGGTAGHVMPNLALLPFFKQKGWQVEYAGTSNGVEKELAARSGLRFHSIKSGKLRRYFSWKNFVDPFLVVWGCLQAVWLLKRLRPSVVFSKGGFASVPTVIAAKLTGIPVVLHESDFTPGLANKLMLPMAHKICLSFPETLDYVPQKKAVWTGTPVRNQLLEGSDAKARKLWGIPENKPVLIVMGGSLGAQAINSVIRSAIKPLTERFFILHICGKGAVKNEMDVVEGYRQFEFLHEELAHALAVSNVVVSRAGANSIFEFLALRKPMVLVPLPLSVSRGDQVWNAKSFEKQGFCVLSPQETLTPEKISDIVIDVYNRRNEYIVAMEKSPVSHAASKIMEVVESVL